MEGWRCSRRGGKIKGLDYGGYKEIRRQELNVAEKELKKKEEGLFLDQARIDIATEDEIDNIRGTDGIEFKLYQIFDVEIE